MFCPSFKFSAVLQVFYFKFAMTDIANMPILGHSVNVFTRSYSLPPFALTSYLAA